MRDYGKVAPTFWLRGSGKLLRGHKAAQVLALYLFTAPGASMSGLFYLALPSVCHETGLDDDEVLEALVKLEETGVAYYDYEAELVWVPEMARYQIGEELRTGDKRIKGVEREVSVHDGHRFYGRFVSKYKTCFGLSLDVPPPEPVVGPRPTSQGPCTPREAPSEPLRSQELTAPVLVPVGSDLDRGSLDPSQADPVEPASEIAGPREEQASGHGDAAPRPPPPSAGLPAGVRLGRSDKHRRAPQSTGTKVSSDDARVIHAELKAHPSLRNVATVAYAEDIAAQIFGGPKPLPDVLESIAAAARRIGSRRAAGQCVSDVDVADMVVGWAVKLHTPAAPTAGQRASPFAPVDPNADRVRAYYGAKWTRATGEPYACPTSDLGPAGRLWAEAVGAADRSRGDANGGWSPSAEEVARHWIDRGFADKDRRIVDKSWPLSWIAANVGTYGMPQEPKRRRQAEPPPPSERAPVISLDEHRASAAAALEAQANASAGSAGTGEIVPRPRVGGAP